MVKVCVQIDPEGFEARATMDGKPPVSVCCDFGHDVVPTESASRLMRRLRAAVTEWRLAENTDV